MEGSEEGLTLNGLREMRRVKGGSWRAGDRKARTTCSVRRGNQNSVYIGRVTYGGEMTVRPRMKCGEVLFLLRSIPMHRIYSIVRREPAA